MSCNNLKILYVDHDLLSRSLAVFMIWQLGYWCDVVSSSKRALLAFHRQPYDLVFIDQQMPDTSTVETARAMRAWEDEIKQRPCLICSLIYQEDYKQEPQYEDNGITAYIKKPCTFDGLRSMLRLAEADPLGYDCTLVRNLQTFDSSGY